VVPPLGTALAEAWDMSARVRDAMSSHDLLVVAADDLLDLAAQMLLWSGVRHLPVVAPSGAATLTRQGKVVGVLCERDILRRQASVGARAPHVRVAEAMSAPAITVGPDEPLASAASMMLERRVGCLPVVTEGKLVGLLSTTDLLRPQLDTERPQRLPSSAVRDVMKSPPVTVTPDTEIFAATSLMSTRQVRHLPVVDRENRVVGMLSDRDIRAAVGDPHRFLADDVASDRVARAPVDEIMSKTVMTVEADAPVSAVFDGLIKTRVGALPVVDGEGRLVGIVSYLDALQALR
jgi:CBS domain-containing protein